MEVLNCQAPSPRHRGVLRISGLTEPRTNGRVDPGPRINGSIQDPNACNFTISFCNIRGLSSNLPSVEYYLLTSSPNLLCLTETQVSSDVSLEPFSIPNYNLFPCFRSKGGVCVYAHSTTPVTRLSHLESPNYDVLWLKLALPSCTKFICSVYRSPNAANSSDFFDYLTLQYETIVSNNPRAEVIFLGDFNVHHKDWLHSSHTDTEGETAYTFSIYNDLDQLIQFPTRIPDQHSHTPQTLDLFLSTDLSPYSYSILCPLGSSDHNLITVSCSASLPSPLQKNPRRFWHYRSADWSSLKEFYSEFPWEDFCFASDDTSVCADRVTEVIMAGIEAYIPSSIYHTPKGSQPWFDDRCSEAISQRDTAFKAWQQSPSEISHSCYISARNNAKSVLRSAKHNFLIRKCNELSSSSSESSLWSLAKNITHNFSQSSFPPLFRADGSVATTPGDKANLFGTLFSSNSTLDDSNFPVPPVSPLSEPMPKFFICSKTVWKFLKALNAKKAHGPDGVPPRILKECASVLAPVLARLFRRCISSRMFPSSWKHALVHPVPKKGDRSNPSNYRPIALTASISKVF